MAVRKEKGDPIDGDAKHNEHFKVQDLMAIGRWKLGKDPKGKKEDLIHLCINTPDPLPRPEWTDEEEERSQELQSTEIKFEDTALNVALTQNVNSVKNNIATLDKEAATELLQALQQRVQETSEVTVDALGNEHAPI